MTGGVVMFEGGPAATLTSSLRYAPTALWVAALTLICRGSAPPGAGSVEPAAQRRPVRSPIPSARDISDCQCDASPDRLASCQEEKCVRQIYFFAVFRH